MKMTPSDIRFWIGYFYIGPTGSGLVNRTLGLGNSPGDASNGDRGCQIIPFPKVRSAATGCGPAAAVDAQGAMWRRARRGAEMIWSHPRTQGAFVVQRLVAITLAVTLASLFERICE